VGDDEDRRPLEARFDAARVTAVQATDDYRGPRARGVATQNTADGRDQTREPTQEAMHYPEPILSVPPPGLHQDGAPPHDLAT
jgi:hypothetical protein